MTHSGRLKSVMGGEMLFSEQGRVEYELRKIQSGKGLYVRM